MESQTIKQAIAAVHHVALNVADPQGAALADRFVAGGQFPLFVLTDADGSVISRWAGYTGASQFIATLSANLRDPITVNERQTRCQSLPSLSDALFLARYFGDIKQNLKAVKYYRLADSLPGPRVADALFDAVRNGIQAAWDDQWPFDSAAAMVDNFLTKPANSPEKTAGAVKLFTKLSLKKKRTDQLLPVLRQGLAVTRSDPKQHATFQAFAADSLLFVHHDTAGAMEMYSSSLGSDWKTNLTQQYRYCAWCFERGLNLDEVQAMLARVARYAQHDLLRGMSLQTLARLQEERGELAVAVRLMEMAVEASPQNRYYHRELDRLRSEAGADSLSAN